MHVLKLSLNGIHERAILDSMKTTVDIPNDLLEEAMSYSGAETKKDAIITAMEFYVRSKKIEAVTSLFGSAPDFPTKETLKAEWKAARDRKDRSWG
jgi:Arc/MetJ family transcription regulator